ncbi:MAG TPA: hydroxysqualene dehydroxylase HpnE [Thiobacillus sp.]|nr:hydroxysqualene dehydroxylase HpnE [Thiobacillus sp.]
MKSGFVKSSVAVIGGGWAGCASALTLAEAGIPVTLYEASRTLGGRARAVEWEGQKLDNGQHILLGAYQQTVQLIQRLGSIKGLWRLPLSLNQPPDFSLTCPRLPAPLHLLMGLLGAKGLDWHEKMTAARWAHTLLNGSFATEHATVDQLTRTQPEKLNRLLWHPLCISALNTPPEIASARVFQNVIRGAFGGRNLHSDLLLPRCDLTALFPAPAAARIVELGGSVRLSSRVTALGPTPDRITLRTCNDADSYSHVILAVAPQHLADLIFPVAELNQLAIGMADYRYQAIATVYIQYDPAFKLHKPLLALAGGPAQFVFDRGQSHGQAGLLAFVASAATHLPTDWMDQAEAQLRRSARPGKAHWRKSIIEKQATYACIPHLARPATRTQHPRIFLAGDYTDGAYPATLESATLSGVQSANFLLEQL